MKQFVTFSIAILVVAVSIFLYQKNLPSKDKDISSSPSSSSPTLLPVEKSATFAVQEEKDVPMPTEEDIISLFFTLINDKRIPEAITMMSENMVPNESTKQAWGVHFNAIKSIHVQEMEPFGKNDWTDKRHTYKVTLEAYVSAEAKDASIPYYGWGDNPNIRWVTIERNDKNIWQIAEIATGP